MRGQGGNRPSQFQNGDCDSEAASGESSEVKAPGIAGKVIPPCSQLTKEALGACGQNATVRKVSRSSPRPLVFLSFPGKWRSPPIILQAFAHVVPGGCNPHMCQPFSITVPSDSRCSVSLVPSGLLHTRGSHHRWLRSLFQVMSSTESSMESHFGLHFEENRLWMVINIFYHHDNCLHLSKTLCEMKNKIKQNTMSKQRFSMENTWGSSHVKRRHSTMTRQCKV